LSALTSLLQAKWKGGAKAGASRPDPLRAGQVRDFKIVELDREAKRVAVEVA
jgi:small subunit ribosomal protein S1